MRHLIFINVFENTDFEMLSYIILRVFDKVLKVLQIKKYKRSHATTFNVIKRNEVGTSVSAEQNHCKKFIAGCIYDSLGKKIISSERIGATGGDHVASYNPDSIILNNEIKYVEKKSIYLGPWMNHYGHFITETLSRFWFYEASFNNHQLYFHPFIFGDNKNLLPFQVYLLECLGVDVDNIKTIDGPLHFKELSIPDSAWNINMKAAPQAYPVYKRIRDLHKSDVKFKKVFLSIKKSVTNRILNIPEIEKVFRNLGFIVLYPEDLSIKEQLNVYSNCDVLSGFSGSALHNCVFTYKSTLIIEIADKRTRDKALLMQKAALSISENCFELIHYKEDREGNFELGYLETELRNSLKKII